MARNRNRNGYERSFMDAVLSPIRSFVGLFSSDDEIRSERTIVEHVIAFVTFPFRLLYGFALFMIFAWTTSRNGYAFIRAIPAIGAIAVFAATAWVASNSLDRRVVLAQNYHDFHVENNPDKPAYAELFAQKLVDVGPAVDIKKHLFQLGVAKSKNENFDEAMILMRGLAPADSPGFPQAHVWLSSKYMSQPELAGENSEALATKHFKLALEAEAGYLPALLGLSELYESRGDSENAVVYLDQLINSKPMTLIHVRKLPKLIELKKELGRDKEAEAQLESAMLEFTSLTRRYSDEYELWLSLVRCSLLVKNYEQAAKTVEEGYQLAKSEAIRRRLQRLRSMVMIRRADDFKSMESVDDFKNHLGALCSSVRSDPLGRDSYDRLINFVNPETNAEEKSFWLRESLLGSPHPAVVHVILGMQEMIEGNFSQGRKHWRIADQQSNAAQYIVNNMIDASFRNDRVVLENTLDMITVGAELFPDQPLLYQTRGMYRKRIGEIESAIKDLEFALTKLPDLVAARKALIECYSELGNDDAVLMQRREIDRILAELNPSDRRIVEAYLEQK